MDACLLCRGLEELLRRHEVQRIVVQGRNEGGRVEWVVDVITVGAEGHKAAATLDEAMNVAIGEAVATNGPG